jgi:hypothetical protein
VTLAEQLEAAKRQAEVRKLDAGDARVATELAQRIRLPEEELPASIRTCLDGFNKRAIARQARRCPAKPATCALFVLFQADMGISPQHILAQLSAIERLHDRWGLSNPVRTAIVRAALETVIKIDPPRGWSFSERVEFASLPPDVREIIVNKERLRDKALRRAQNEAAEAKKTAATNEADIKHVQIEKELRNEHSQA